MKILVCFKVLPNPDGILEEDWNSFSLSSDLSYAGLDYNCFDASALEIGLKIKEQAAVQETKVTCTALSVCSKITPKFAQGLFSVGFDDVVSLKMQNREFKSREIARLISNYAKEIGADIVLTGAQAGNAETGMVPYYVSHFMNFPIISNVETASFNNKNLICNVRENGALIEKKVKMPLVVSVNNSPEVLRFASLKARMACRTKMPSVVETDADETLIEPILSRPQKGRNCTYLEKDSKESVKTVLDMLKEFSGADSDKSDSESTINPKWESFIRDKALLVNSDSLYGEDFEELLSLYESDKKSLVVLPDTQEGRTLAIRLCEKENMECFFSAAVKDITEKSITLKKYVCAANLEWEKTLEYPAVITVNQSEAEKFKNAKTLLLSSPECDKLGWIEETKILEDAQASSLNFASLVIACGAGMGNKENCEKVRLLAKKLGAGFGLTRPSALNAWGSPNEIIGLSGTITTPKCCLALGTAGAGAFMLGIENSEKIIAVNTDSNALIFKNADIGINTDAVKFVDDLLSLLE